MSFTTLLQQCSGPMMMEQSALASWYSSLKSAEKTGFISDKNGVYASFDMFAETSSESGPSDHSRIAVIPVSGTLLNKRMWSSSYATGYDFLHAAIDYAAADDSVETIVFEIDSPGGMVAGLFDLTDKIAGIEKKTVAHTADMAASAAYAIFSSCDEGYLSQSAEVGSVGVLQMHFDISGALENFGESVSMIFYGDKKVDGNPYEPLPERVKGEMQDDINNLGAMFSTLVATNRNISVESVVATQAGVYRGQAAVDIGFADGVMNFDDLINELSASTDEGETMSFTQEELDAAVASALAAQTTDSDAAVSAERERVRDIMGLDEATGREEMARKLSDQGFTADQAKIALSAAPIVEPAADYASLQAGAGAVDDEEEQEVPVVQNSTLLHNRLRFK